MTTYLSAGAPTAPVVVTGASGRIGRSLIRNLSTRGIPVRAISRTAEPREIDPGVTWVTADLSQPETLPRAFAGGERMFLLTSADERLVESQRNAIEAARRAGIRHVVKLSALGASDHSRSLVASWHYTVERELINSGVDWTILRPHYFMDNLLDQAGAVRSESRVYSPVGPARLPFIDSRDIADVGAVALTGPGHGGRKYTLTGGEALGYSEVASSLSQVLGRTISCVEESPEEARRRLLAQHLPDWQVESALALWSYQRAGGTTSLVSPEVARLLGKEPRTLMGFLRNHATEFGAPGDGPNPAIPSAAYTTSPPSGR